MNLLKAFFLSRKTILLLIGVTTAAITAAALIPQSFMTPPGEMDAWRSSYPRLSRVTELLGLHRVYTHPAFAVLLAGVVVSLLLSSFEQFRAALRRTAGPREAAAGGRVIQVPVGIDALAAMLRSRGYIATAGGEHSMSLVRHPWGYWGNFLLHLGMFITIASSLLIAVTQQRGLVHIAEGEVFHPAMPWFLEENGIAAGPLTLPFSVRLEKLHYSFWPTYGVKDVASTLSILCEGRPMEHAEVRINSILRVQGLDIYQGIDFGHAFYVEVNDWTGKREVLQLLMPHQRTPDMPSYNDFHDVLNGRTVLRAKYFVDAEKRSLDRFDPLIVLRVDQFGREMGQLPLRVGEGGSIGSYQFRLFKVSLWTRLVFVNITGMPGVFTGFFVIVLGGVLHYFTPPREVVLSEMGAEGTRMAWRATKFSDFYQDEYDSLCQAATKGVNHG